MIKDFIKRYIPTVLFISLGVLISCIIIYTISIYNVAVADFINGTVATALRSIMEAITHVIPISIFELILISIIPLVVLITVLIIREGRGAVARIRTSLALLGVTGILYSGYLLVMAVGYRTTPLVNHLDLEDRRELSADEIYEATRYLKDRVNELDHLIERDSEGVSHSGYDMHTLSKKVSEAYEIVRGEYPFFHNLYTEAKPVIFSGVMSDAGISGIYTYFTGESNINVEYPDFSVTFVVAHEFAHQRGIMRENEANFMAFLTTVSSPDPYLQYSGYLYMYLYMSNALYSASPERYMELRSQLSGGAISDLARSSEITRAHANSWFNNFMESLNDSYLQSNGTAGVVSYGYVVRITVAYLTKQGII